MSHVVGKDSRNRHAAAALLLTLMALLAALAGTHHGLPAWPAGVAAWLAGALLWPQLAAAQKRQSLWLAGIGLLAFALTIARGGQPLWISLLTQNSALLGMLVAVSFLQLLAAPATSDAGLPRGKGALWRTMLGAHLLGSVINLSAVFIMADRIGSQGKPAQAQATALIRAFLAAAMWSPFFAATAVALTYAPGANPLHLALFGVAFAALLLLLAYRDIVRQSGDGAAGFVGYPLQPATLYVPGLLAALVGAGHWLFAGWAALSIISIAALLVVSVISVLRHGVLSGCRSLAAHAERRLPNMAGEVILFLSAGTLASGLTSLIGTGQVWLPFTGFGVIEAAGVLAAMILLAVIGIHTVISITLVGSWLAPLHPDPLLLALVFVMSWAIGLAAGPLSGIHLAIQGRYGIASTLLARSNLRYCVQAYCAAVAWLALVRWATT
jgi:hypothetical protein